MDGNSSPRRIPLSHRRLNKPGMYKKVFQGGRALRGAPLTLRFIRMEQDCSRVGFIIRKKTGNAPMRNSIRRTLRQSFTEALPGFGEGAWLVFDVSDKAAQYTRTHLKGEADRLLRAAVASEGAGR